MHLPVFQCKSARHDARSTIDILVEKCKASLTPVTEKLEEEIEDAFDNTIRNKLETGSNNAVQTADKTCALWGAPVIFSFQNSFIGKNCLLV